MKTIVTHRVTVPQLEINPLIAVQRARDRAQRRLARLVADQDREIAAAFAGRTDFSPAYVTEEQDAATGRLADSMRKFEREATQRAIRAHEGYKNNARKRS